jgi:Fic family protein
MEFNEKHLHQIEILTETEKKVLEDITQKYQFKYLFAERNINDVAVDFAYTNARVEGCSYTYQEAETLLFTGKTAHNKSFHDAQMIINLKNTYIFIMNNKELKIDYLSIKNFHKMLMSNLLQDNELATVRNIPVRIGGSKYIPSTDTSLLEDSLQRILKNSLFYDNAFEKSIYLHNNIAYLQYFTDGNKRVARTIQTATLVTLNKMPMFYIDEIIDEYKKALINYYETGNYNTYKDFFLNNYAKSLDNTFNFLRKKEKVKNHNIQDR